MSNFITPNLPFDVMTPNIEKSEGVRVAKHYVVPGYLPRVRFSQKTNAYTVISYGKVVSVDSADKVVPAGLLIDIETAKTAGHTTKAQFIAAAANYGNVYSLVDLQGGVKNFQGELVEVGEPVVASFFTDYDVTKAQLNYVSNPLGMIAMNAFEENGSGYGQNPLDYKYKNYNLQSGVTILTRYFIELPVVAALSGIKYPGLTVFHSAAVKQGDIVSFTKESNFTVAPAIADVVVAGADAAAVVASVNEKIADLVANINNNAGKVLGRVYSIDTDFPKDFLDYVKTWDAQLATPNPLHKTPGTLTSGLPDNLSFAGVTDPSRAKTVRINLIVA